MCLDPCACVPACVFCLTACAVAWLPVLSVSVSFQHQGTQLKKVSVPRPTSIYVPACLCFCLNACVVRQCVISASRHTAQKGQFPQTYLPVLSDRLCCLSDCMSLPLKCIMPLQQMSPNILIGTCACSCAVSPASCYKAATKLCGYYLWSACDRQIGFAHGGQLLYLLQGFCY